MRQPVLTARRAAAAALRLARARGRLSVVLSDDSELRRLNGGFRGRDHATNVLAFPTRHSLGDVVLARSVVLREARAEHVPPAARLSHLVVHGVLHLAGHDHDAPRTARAMENAEAACLRRLGLANPWRRAP
jgi:probable rRNA maturation factor